MRVKTAASICFIFILLFIFSPRFSNTVTPDAKVYILCYHAFLERKDPYSITEGVLKEQLEALKGGGFNFISMPDIKNGTVKGDKNILVTIDDGNKSTHPAFFNVMKPMGIKPLLGIYPAIIGRTSYALTWEQLKELSDEGCYIAAHGYNHLYVSEKAWKESEAQFKREIYLPKKRLEEKLNIEIDTYVYPFGVKSKQAIDELQKAGYKYAFTIVPQKTKIPFLNNFEIPRFLLTKGNIKGLTSKIISGESRVAAKSKNIKKPDKNESKSHLTSAKKIIDKKVETVKSKSETLKNLVINDVVLLPGAIKGGSKKITPDAELIKPENELADPEYVPATGYIPSQLTDNRVDSGYFMNRLKTFFSDLKKSYLSIIDRFRSMIKEFTAHSFIHFNNIKTYGITLIHNSEKPKKLNEE